MNQAEAGLGLTEMAFNSGDGVRAGDEKLLVKFYPHPKEDQTASLEAGRKIFKEVDYIEIIQPGNKDAIIRRPASELDLARFPEHYRRYKARMSEQESIEGTLLKEWPELNRGQVEELNFLKIYTVEHLAELSDTNGQRIMGINALKEKAKAFLEAADQQKAASEMLALRKENADLSARLDEISRKLESLQAEKPRRGRPPKKDTEEADAAA